MRNYDNILDKIYDAPWLIIPSSLEMIVSIVDKKIAGESLSEEELNSLRDGPGTNRDELQLPEQPSVAVLPIAGPIFPKANLMTQLSGATSVGKLSADFDKLMASDKVTAIILDMSTPGGSAEGIPEFAQKVYDARESGIKPIYAVANYMSASGGYYIGSQANKFFASPSSLLGSIGVVNVHTDSSEADAKAGIKRTVLTVGKHKADGNPHEPLSEDAKAAWYENAQETYNQFVADVARGRGTSVENVLENFGQGRVYKASTAHKKGMVDGVRTFESVLSELTNAANSNSFGISVPGIGEKVMAEITPEALEVLGLSEDATSEQVQEAVNALNEKANTPVQSVETPIVDPELAKHPEFMKMAAEVARLQGVDRENNAKMFASQYAQFTSEQGKTGFGLSALALGTVEEMHLKIADGMVTHDDLKSLLDMFAGETAIVDYREVGSSRGKENDVPETGMEAAQKLRDLAYEKVAADGLSYGDALSAVMKENPDLAKIYTDAREASRAPRGGNR